MIYLLIGYMWLFIHRPFEVWPVLGTLRLERIYMLFVILVWALSHRKTWTENPLNPAFFALGLAVLASALLSPFSPGIDAETENWLKVAVLYVLLITSVRDAAELRTLLFGYCFAVTLYAVHSYREFLCGRYFYRMGIVRMVGVDATFNDPNTFAATLVYSIPLLHAALVLSTKRVARIAAAGAIALFALCIFLTGSRSGFLGLLAAGLLHLPRRRRLPAVLVLSGSVLALWTASGESLRNRYLTLIDSSYGPDNAHQSAEARREGFFGGIATFQEYPLLGCGPGRFAEAGASFVQAHNLYGQVLGELGLAGTCAFAAILGAFRRNNRLVRRLAKSSHGTDALTANAVNQAIVRSVLLMLLLGWGGHNLYRYTWLWFGALQALALSTVAATELNQPSSRGLSPWSLKLQGLGKHNSS